MLKPENDKRVEDITEDDGLVGVLTYYKSLKADSPNFFIRCVKKLKRVNSFPKIGTQELNKTIDLPFDGKVNVLFPTHIDYEDVWLGRRDSRGWSVGEDPREVKVMRVEEVFL